MEKKTSGAETFSTVKDIFAEETIHDYDSDSDENTASFHSVETDPNQTYYSLQTKSTSSLNQKRKKNKHTQKHKLGPSSLAADNNVNVSKFLTEKNITKKPQTVTVEQSINNTKDLANIDDKINKSLKKKKSKSINNGSSSKTKDVLEKNKTANQATNLSLINENNDLLHDQINDNKPVTLIARKTPREEITKSNKNISKNKKQEDVLVRKSHKEPRIDHVNPNEKKGRKQKHPKKKELLIRDIINLQKRTDFLIPRLPFARLIRDILMTFTYAAQSLRITVHALRALQESAEMYLTQMFQDAYLCTIHRGRVTLLVKDMELIQRIRSL